MEWYYAIGETKRGPVPEEELRHLVASGQIGAETLVWSADLAGWTPLRDVARLAVFLRIDPETPDDAGPGTVERPEPAGWEPAETDAEPHPWLRWLARIYDTWLFALAFTIVALLVLETTVPAVSTWLFDLPDLVFGMIVMAALIPMEAFLLSIHGTTPGKWLFGLRVAPESGGVPSFSVALQRALMVWWRGLGLGLPLVMLFTQVHAHSKLSSDGATTWDRDTGQVVLHRSMSGGRAALAVLSGIVLFAIYAFLNAYSQMSAY